MVAQSILNGLVAGWIYILVALGLTLVLSIMGIVQLAHGEIYMLGSYGTYLFFVNAGLDFLLAMVLSALIVGLIGIGIEKVFFRPFRGNLESALIISIGLILILQNAAQVTFGGETKAIRSPFAGVIKIHGVILSWERLMVIVVSIVLVSALVLFIQRTRIGKAMVAVSQDLEVAALQGIKVDRVSSVAMFIGCFVAAVAGTLVGALFSVYPTMGVFALMKGIAVIILGGLGSIPGAVIGGLILGLIDGIVPLLMTTAMASLFGFIIVILILLFRPQGIMGHE